MTVKFANPNEVRSEIIYRRTYSREVPVDSGKFETKQDTINRVIGHQRWLWERASGQPLNSTQEAELSALDRLMMDNKVMVSGRTLWMGGTEISKKYEATQFNCAATRIETVYDVVDALWLLLLGSGVGFKPMVGSLTGFAKPIKNVVIVRSKKQPGEKGNPNNVETWNKETKTWTIKIGDSSESWAKSVGKLLAGKFPAETLIIDFSEVRCAGTRLTNFGWISSGDENISRAYENIAKILNRRAGSLLTKIDIMDVMNWLGTSLSSRRSAQICFIDYGSNEWEDFALAKKDYWLTGNPQRAQSNNSLLFYSTPSKDELKKIFSLIAEAGSSEPGFVNANEAERRAPWFHGTNPCFSGSQKLLTQNGYKTMKELWKEYGKLEYGDAYLGKMKVVNRNGLVDSTAVYRTGKSQPIYEVKFKSGRTIEATLNHTFILNDESRVQLKDLKSGDKVHISSGGYFGPIDDQEYALLAGHFIGDGSFGSTKEPNLAKIRLWNEEIDSVGPVLSKTLEKYYEVKGILDRSNNQKVNFDFIGKYKPSHDYYKAEQRSTILGTQLVSDGLSISNKHVIPQSIWNSNKVTVAAFLKGLYSADGHVQYNVKNKCASVMLSQANLGLLEDTQHLLQMFGIESRIDAGELPKKMLRNDGKGGQKLYDHRQTWRLRIGNRASIVKFAEEIGFLQQHKNEVVETYLNNHKGSGNSANKGIDVVVDINYLKHEDTYCLTEHKNNEVVVNGVVIGQCAEILLPSKGFCNLAEINLAAFRGDTYGLHEAARLIARANYRQTCVDLRDGILQEAWHLNNAFLRLCGVGLTGVAQRPELIDYDYAQLERTVTMAAYSMADELDLPRPKNVTCVKPSGTLSKVMGCTEGIHKPLSKYIFNNVVFAKADPLVEKLRKANYKIMDHPLQSGEVVVTLPVAWEDVEFTKVIKNGKTLEVNLDSAVEQLENYKRIQNSWTHQNTSVTISYSPEEIPEIIEWLHNNWDSYVGVSFIYRTDPTMTAKDLGYAYLPQQAVSKEEYEEYVSELDEVDFSGTEADIFLESAECASGFCPTR